MAQSFARLLALTLVAFFALLCLHEAIKGHAITDKNESHNEMAAIFSPLTKLWSGMISPLGKPRHQWARRALWKDYRNSGGSVRRSEFDVSTDFRADRHEHKMVDTPVIRAKGTLPSPPGNPAHGPVFEGMETDSVIRAKGTPPSPPGNPTHGPVFEGMETDSVIRAKGTPPSPPGNPTHNPVLEGMETDSVIRAKGTPPSPPGNPTHNPVLEGMETDSVIRAKGTPPSPPGNPTHNPVLEGMETDCSQRGSPPAPGAQDLRVAASILKLVPDIIVDQFVVNNSPPSSSLLRGHGHAPECMTTDCSRGVSSHQQM